MLDSRDIDRLRPDVAANCRVFLARCAAAGLPAAVTQTVRDNEYQASLYALGRTKPGRVVTNARTASFHSVQAGLAFDICRDVRGGEYSDGGFFRAAAAVAKEIGFSWGGDWDSFPDLPHFQWDDHGAYTAAEIRAGVYPPAMPAAEEEHVTQTQFNQMMEAYLDGLRTEAPSDYSAEARAWAEGNGIIFGNAAGEKQYKMYCTREQLVTFLKRLEDSRGA